MTEDHFIMLAALIWLACALAALWSGFGRRWWGLLLAPLVFVIGFAGLMALMVALAPQDAGGDLAWLGFAPVFAAPFALALPVGFGLGRLAALLRRRG